MAPPRQRTAAVMDDSRSEASSGTREYRNAATKSRKPAGSTQKASVTSVPVEALEDQPRLPWSDLPLDILHAYRHAHKLSTPSAYSNDYSRIILSQGIGLRSPTALATRRGQARRGHNNASQSQRRSDDANADADASSADSNSNANVNNPSSSSVNDAALHRIISQGRVSKDQFALAVRKHFNSAGLSEQESIARFLYTVREERRGRQFRLRFLP
ncbi:hypothetical protein N7474_011076 [Penicillium riverlandense]|uniref:uncharacterized protein n=1 Tax=Penicillium riverlandense TaxID=1903569 RepID=UPI0025480AA3|nr:uncharacterized protein N7474_011076 [Penicillium riverlandense]KAJ5805189.1 hypothetical protein N7474_011076 [Penicillium riverlandense]